MFGKLSQEDIEKLLQEQLIGRIGCYAEGMIYVVPVSYAYDGKYIYCHTFEGLKMKIMRKNPMVCFEVENSRDLANWQSVIAWGNFEELNTEEEKKEAVRVLSGRKLPFISSETMHLDSYWPFTAVTDGGIKGIFFRIALTEKTGRYEKEASRHFFAS